MNKKFFENIPQIGTLKFEEELFSFENIPIVFVCIDKNNNRYLCVCDDIIEEESWIITKVSKQELLKVLNDEWTILSVFKDKNIIVANKPFGREMEYIITEYNKIDPDELPLSDQYLEMKEYLSDYIDKISKSTIFNIPMPQFLFYQNDYAHFIMTSNTTYNTSSHICFNLDDQTFNKSMDLQTNDSFQVKIEYETIEDSEECEDYYGIMFAA